MRILSWRLIVALVIGVTLVSLASSWFEVRTQKDALRADLERQTGTLGDNLAGRAELYLQLDDRGHLEQILGNQPGNLYALRRLAELELDYGDPTSAEKIYLKLINGSPTCPGGPWSAGGR